MEFAIGKKRKAKVKKRPKLKERRQQKKSMKSSGGGSLSDLSNDDESGDFAPEKRTTAEKAELGLNIASGVMGAIGNTIGQIRANKADTADAGDDTGNGYKSGNTDTEETGIKKYMPYILGGVGLLFVAVLAYFVMKKKK